MEIPSLLLTFLIQFSIIHFTLESSIRQRATTMKNNNFQEAQHKRFNLLPLRWLGSWKEAAKQNKSSSDREWKDERRLLIADGIRIVINSFYLTSCSWMSLCCSAIVSFFLRLSSIFSRNCLQLKLISFFSSRVHSIVIYIVVSGGSPFLRSHYCLRCKRKPELVVRSSATTTSTTLTAARAFLAYKKWL